MFSSVIPVQVKIHTMMVMLLDPVGTWKAKSMRKKVYLEFLFSAVESIWEIETI